MNNYQKLRTNKPKLTVNNNAKQVVFKVVSSMCDNIAYISFNKRGDGLFSIRSRNEHGISTCLSNYQMVGDFHNDLVWDATDGLWDKVAEKINSGTSVIESVRAR